MTRDFPTPQGGDVNADEHGPMKVSVVAVCSWRPKLDDGRFDIEPPACDTQYRL
jgi:hypothetical protein